MGQGCVIAVELAGLPIVPMYCKAMIIAPVPQVAGVAIILQWPHCLD